jgi:glycosyltransferase involved in cell wall biosynthesis
MSFSIVIPVLNEAVCLPLILGDIADQTLRPELVVVADCGSTDGTLELLKERYPYIVLVKSQDKSPASARNEGAMAVNSDHLMFIDADVRIPQDFCSELLDCDSRASADISYPKFLSDGKSVMGAIHVWYVRLWLWFWRRVKPDRGIGGVVCIKRGVFEVLGKFNENLIKGEDVELYMKASKSGFKINYCKTVICHVSSRRTRGLGIVRTILEDGPVIRKTRRNQRDYVSYK